MLQYGMSELDVFMLNFSGVSINIFGSIAILSGIVLFVIWAYRKNEDVGPTAGTEKLNREPQPEEYWESDGPNPTIGSTDQTSPMHCSFSGWIEQPERIVQEWTYYGGGVDRTLQIELRVERSKLSAVGTGQILKLFYVWVAPQTGHQGVGKLKLTKDQTEESTGWLPIRIAPAANDSTLIALLEREGSEAFWRMMVSGVDLSIAIKMNGEEFISLPLPNTSGLEELALSRV